MSLIIKMDTIKTEEHLRKSIPYIMNEKKTGGLCFSNSGITSEQIVDTFFLTKQIHPTPVSYTHLTLPTKLEV